MASNYTIVLAHDVIVADIYYWLAVYSVILKECIVQELQWRVVASHRFTRVRPATVSDVAVLSEAT